MDITNSLERLPTFSLDSADSLLQLFLKLIEIASYDSIEDYQIVKLCKYNLVSKENNRLELQNLLVLMKDQYIHFSKIEKLYSLVYATGLICNLMIPFGYSKKDVFAYENEANKQKNSYK